MNSCLYEVSIMHDRQLPKRYRFTHKVFMFYLDLDELTLLPKQSWLLGYHQARIYNVRDDDHIHRGQSSLKENILDFLKTKGIAEQIATIKLLTNVRTFGYIFNPVSFYVCLNAQGEAVCIVPEIGNTFGELKYFYLGPDKRTETQFKDQQTKYYYISPFTELENVLDFRVQVPDEQLNIAIDVEKNGKKFFFTSMIGPRKELTTANLIWYTLKYPLVTLKVIFLIHWHAAILHFFKHVEHQPKESNPHLQREVYREWNKQ